MKTILYTGHDKTYKPLADITVPRMAYYAEKRGIEFTCYQEPLIDVPNGIYWTGVCGALKAFREGYDAVMYLDVDQLVTNHDATFPSMTRGFHASKDWGSDAVEPWRFSMCGFMATPSIARMLESVVEMEPEWRDKPFPEQGPMQWMVAKIMNETSLLTSLRDNKENLEGLINLHPRNVFNNVPDEICPGNVPEPWTPQSWCAHLTMVSLEKRIEIANNIIKKHGL